MRGATYRNGGKTDERSISIHAPHAGRDYLQSLHRVTPSDFNPRAPCGARQYRRYMQMQQENISIHAPHAGRDDFLRAVPVLFNLFQSTRPMRGATSHLSGSIEDLEFQSTRPMRGATRSRNDG